MAEDLTGIQETQLNSVSVYPNPAEDNFYLTNLSTYRVEYRIMDVGGRVVKKGAVSQASNYISVSSLSPGVYVLLVAENHHKTIRFIKEE
tara:strand:+ start:1012 stop:1281 length:270 start_codon:yes stop_codon:yes gene_type:complete